MRFWAHDRWGFPLPEGHRFPLAKYRLLREAVEARGLGEVRPSPPAPWEALGAIHDADYADSSRKRHGRAPFPEWGHPSCRHYLAL
jgi:acetoin utilization deacetylase AcuC-like enzyme